MRLLMVLFLGLAALGGCANYSHDVRKPATFRAVGYGTVNDDLRYNPAQRRLMGVRAAKLDAYRNLAEQVHGLQITGQSTVSQAMLRNDSFRTYVDAFLRGARLVTINPLDETTYEVTVELDVGRSFYDCADNPQACGTPPQASAKGTADDCAPNCASYPSVRYQTP